MVVRQEEKHQQYYTCQEHYNYKIILIFKQSFEGKKDL